MKKYDTRILKKKTNKLLRSDNYQNCWSQILLSDCDIAVCLTFKTQSRRQNAITLNRCRDCIKEFEFFNVSGFCMFQCDISFDSRYAESQFGNEIELILDSL